MNIKLGEKIKVLRKRDSRRQEDLAAALGVTNQAVSRWESDGCYPDMELIPSIANYFGISIDELFGYESDRQKKIDKTIECVDKYDISHRDDGDWVEECLLMLRESLAEFPNNERLLITLAETLWEAGWRRNHGNMFYDTDGFIKYDFDHHKKNEFWLECVKICENLIENTKDNGIFTRAVKIIVPLYRNFGEYEKAISYAIRMPSLCESQEFLLTEATDGKEQAEYVGKFLLESVRQLSEQIIFGLVANIKSFETDMPIEKVKGAISLFSLICDDGNFGVHHDFVSKLYLYLSRLQWEKGYTDDAFSSLDLALEHAKAFEALFDEKEHRLSARLVSFVKYDAGEKRNTVRNLSVDWPFYCYPDFSKVEAEIKKDPRWDLWVEKTQS